MSHNSSDQMSRTKMRKKPCCLNSVGSVSSTVACGIFSIGLWTEETVRWKFLGKSIFSLLFVSVGWCDANIKQAVEWKPKCHGSTRSFVNWLIRPTQNEERKESMAQLTIRLSIIWPNCTPFWTHRSRSHARGESKRERDGYMRN